MLKKRILKLAALATPALFLLSINNIAVAGGYQNTLSSVEGLGRAYAGEVANKNVLSTFLNPANILLTEDQALSNSFIATYLIYDIDTKHNPYSEAYSPAAIASDPLGFLFNGDDPKYRFQPLEDEDVDDVGTKIVIPAVAYAKNMGGWGYGLAAGSHFAYEFDPKDIYSVGDTFGDLYIKVAHITTNLAYQLTDNISVGLGVSGIVGFFKADRRAGDLANLIQEVDDVGSGIIGDNLTDALFDALSASELKNRDAKIAKFKGNDITWGWNVGITWQPSPRDRFSLVYHASSELEFEGDYKSDLPEALNPIGNIYNGLLNTGVRQSTPGDPLFPEGTNGNKIDATVKLELPEWLEYGAWHQINDDWELYYSVRWTSWTNRTDAIIIEADDGSGRGANFPLVITDSIKFSVGADYRVNEDWKVRAGFAVDEGWHPNEDVMILDSPDSRRWWLSTGATWQQNETTSWDFAVGYIYFEGNTIKEDGDILERTRDRLPGVNQVLGIENIQVEADITTGIATAGIQFNKKF